MPSDPADSGSFDPGWKLGAEFNPAGFSGIARLFPLPASALYPRVVQPLHIFEERYREMMRDALDSDGLIAMSVLQPGWESDYASRPPLESVACLGSIVTHHRMEDGRYNLLLAGVTRVRIIEEIDPPQSFRRARVELLNEVEPDAELERGRALKIRLAELFKAALPHGVPPEPLQRLFEDDTPLSLLADLAAYTLPIGREAKLAALTELDVMQRASGLIVALGNGEEDDGESGEGPAEPNPLPTGFPPPFSSN